VTPLTPCPRIPANPSVIPLDCRTQLARDMPAGTARPTPEPDRPWRTLRLAAARGFVAVAPARRRGTRQDRLAGVGAPVCGFASDGSADNRPSASSLHVLTDGSSSGTHCIDDDLLLRASILTTPPGGSPWICFPAAAPRRKAPASGSGNRRRVDHGLAAAKGPIAPLPLRRAPRALKSQPVPAPRRPASLSAEAQRQPRQPPDPLQHDPLSRRPHQKAEG
jgi:hypothetical protein